MFAGENNRRWNRETKEGEHNVWPQGGETECTASGTKRRPEETARREEMAPGRGIRNEVSGLYIEENTLLIRGDTNVNLSEVILMLTCQRWY